MSFHWTDAAWVGDVIQGLGLIINAGVGGAIIWYTLETRRLRKSAEEQLALTRKQFKIAIRPELSLRRTSIIEKDDEKALRKGIKAPYLLIRFANDSSQLGLRPIVVVRRHKGEGYRSLADWGAHAFGPGESLSFVLNTEVTEERLLQLCQRRLGPVAVAKINEYLKGHEAFLVIMCVDVSDDLHVFRWNIEPEGDLGIKFVSEPEFYHQA